MGKLTNVTSLTGLGLRDWLVQRVSAVILAAYILFLIGFILLNAPLQFNDWQNLFANSWMRIFSILALLSLVMHAWVGMWTIATDYLKITWMRLIFQVAMIVALFAYLAWGVAILYRGF